MEPTTEDIRRTLAEFMGWHRFSDGGWARHGSPLSANPPDYSNDLNAMHSVEQELEKRGLSEQYVDFLVYAVWQQKRNTEDWQNEGSYKGCPYPDRQRWAYGQYFDYAHATASQRARAAYQVIKAQEAGNE